LSLGCNNHRELRDLILEVNIKHTKRVMVQLVDLSQKLWIVTCKWIFERSGDIMRDEEKLKLKFLKNNKYINIIMT